jgi:predicted RNase H-like nuclease (RuvC/YqgF family)
MSNIDNYIEKRSYEELVEASVPTGAYDSVVFTIRSDKMRNGRYSESKLYQGKFEYYAVEGAVLRNNFENNKSLISNLKKKVDEARDSIDEMNKKIDKLKEKASLNNTENKELKDYTTKIPKLEKAIPEYIEEICELEQIIVSDKDKLDKYQWNEYIARGEYNRLSRAHSDYFKTNDLEYLCKAVHMICSYSDKLRYGNKYIAPYKGYLLKEKDSPFSPEITARMNHNAEHVDWFDDNW